MIGRWLNCLLACYVTGFGGAALAQSMAQEDLVTQAQMLANDFQANLKGALTQAMATGGPVSAIDVCKVDAPAIADELSSEGWVVSRTALLVRNPANAPDQWERNKMEQMVQQLSAGKAPGELVIAEIRDTDEGRTFAYMQPIMTGKLCLTCHGEPLAQPVAEALSRLYPNDQAVGFSEGDLRGAFSFVKLLPSE